MTSPRDDSKPALRRALRAARPAPADQARESAAIRAHLRSWLAAHPATTVAAFSAIPGEPEVLSLAAEMTGHRWLLPRMDGERLHFHPLPHGPHALRTGPFGVAEPAADSPVCPLPEIDIFLCPGMAFTTEGARLGRGKGYYDRALAGSSSSAIRIGVCFRAQVLPTLPVEAHDLAMHFLATADGIRRCH